MCNDGEGVVSAGLVETEGGVSCVGSVAAIANSSSRDNG